MGAIEKKHSLYGQLENFVNTYMIKLEELYAGKIKYNHETFQLIVNEFEELMQELIKDPKAGSNVGFLGLLLKFYPEYLAIKKSSMEGVKWSLLSIPHEVKGDILIEFSQFCQKLGYNSIYDAYTSCYGIDQKKMIHDVDNYLINTKERYEELLDHFYHKYTHDSGPSYKIKYLRSLYNTRWLKRDLRRTSYKDLINNLSKFLIKSKFIDEEMLEKIHFRELKSARSNFFYEAICLFSRKEETISQVDIFLPKLKSIQQLKSMIHEYGHSVHLLNIPSETPLKFLGESAKAEYVGVLFESLLRYPRFLKMLGFEEKNLEAISHSAQFFQLLITRFSLGKYYYFSELLSNPLISEWDHEKLNLYLDDLNKKYVQKWRETILINDPKSIPLITNYFYQLDNCRIYVNQQKCLFEKEPEKILEQVRNYFKVDLSSTFHEIINQSAA